MSKRMLVNLTLAAAFSLSALGAAEAMPISAGVNAPALDRNAPVVEKAAILVVGRRRAVRVVRRRPAVVLRRPGIVIR